MTATADMETSSDAYASRFRGEVGRFFGDVQSSTVLDLLAPWPGASVLDVGGGHAQLAPVLVERGFRVTVADSDEVRRLIEEGHQVTALEYKEGLKTREIRGWGAEVVLGSVTDMDVVRRAVEGAEVVHHVAAAFREMDVPESHYHEVNVGGTRNVLQAALDAGVRKVVCCSTCGVHGNVDPPPAGEGAPIQPADYYQRTKWEAEPIAREFFERGLPTTILRPPPSTGRAIPSASS